MTYCDRCGKELQDHEIYEFDGKELCEDCLAHYGYQEDPKEILSAAKDDSATRYACVNLMNTETIEFRIFRGTLKLNTLLATLQMVNQICDVALFYSDEEVKRLSWTDFMSRIEEPELIQYLKERRLNINDAVGGEEDL